MNFGIYSFSHSSLNEQIAVYQKQVFDKFSIPIQQVVSDDTHPIALEKIIRDSSEDYLIFFDVDCIPLNSTFLPIICNQIESNNTLAGAMQCSNHNDKSRLYVGPCFCGFSKILYEKCGKPFFSEWGNRDAMQNFTDQCHRLQTHHQIRIQYWMVTDGGDQCWDMPEGQKFGHGTIYEKLIYHQFEIRKIEQQRPFIDKCKDILCDS